MTSPEQVMALLVEANPIPDVEALERSATFRPDDMMLDTMSETASRSRTRRVQWAVAAAIIAMSMALILWLGNRPTTVDPVDTVPAPTVPAIPAPTDGPRPEGTAETTPTPEPTSPSLEGQSLTGRWDAVSFSLVFEPERYAVTSSDLAVDTGTYLFEEGELILVSDDSSGSCPAGSQARFTVEFTAETLELEPVADDECGFNRGVGVGSKSLEPGEVTGIPPSVLDVARPLSQISGPGIYTAERFLPGFSIVLPPGWRFHASSLPPDIDFATSINDNTALVLWRRQEVNSPAEVYELFANTSGVEAGDRTPISIAGVEGITFDYLQTQINTLLLVPGIQNGNIVAPPDNMWRTWALDVDGVVVTIVASMTPATFSEKANEIEQILDSITWISESAPPAETPDNE